MSSAAVAGETLASATESDAAIAITELVVNFGDVRAVDHASFVVRAGEVFGLLGPNGAGKTTTIRVITTLLPPSAGGAHVAGLDVRRNAMAVRQLIGYVPQQLSIDPNLTGWENVWLFARLFDVPRSERAQTIRDALDVVGISDAAERLASTYSGGMIRRLELAQALVNRPRILVLDEPTIGLDPVARAQVWDRVQAMREQLGLTVLMTTHYMDEADALCQRVALMNRGRIRAQGAPAELKAALGPAATLDDVFRHHAGSIDATEDGRDSFRSVRSTRRTARRVG